MKKIFIYFIFCTTIIKGYSSDMNSASKSLPGTISNWHQSKGVQIIDSTTIFDYMDGGGELYLGYRFDHLEVLEYLSEDKNTILVEIFEMDTSDDAFGLLSLDWSGEPISFDDHSKSDSLLTPAIRALYGSGLLRMTTGKYYVRIVAFRETADAKNIVMQIGKLLYKDSTSEPVILRKIPSLDDIGWKIDRDKIAFFRSYMVLNSLFYLSHKNILNLDHSVNAVYVTYDSQPNDSKSNSIRLLMLQYPNHLKTVEALNHFVSIFLPDYKTVINVDELHYTDNFKIEEGWLACKMESNLLYLTFNIPDKSSAEQIINHIKLK